MSNQRDKKRNTLIGVGAVLVLTAGVGGYYVTQSSHKSEGPTLEEQMEQKLADKLFAFTENGVVTLYDSKEGSELDKFDLKTLSTGKEVTMEVKPELTPEKPIETKPVVKEEYEGFLRVPHIVVKGENSWKIQEALTPKRDTDTMLKMVAKANGKTKLHPIFPGQTLYYLKEKDGSSPEAVIEQVETGDKFEKPSIQTVTKKVDENAVYLYHKSEDLKTLYAYNDIEKAFYSVTETKDKITAEVLLELPEIQGVNEFKIVKNKLYVLYENKTKMKEIDLSNPSETKEQPLQGTVDLFTIRDGIVYYTYKDQLSKLNMADGEHSEILLGDKSTDYVFTAEHLFVLNSFGSKLDNSVLVKVNPLDLKVEDLVELKSNENAILSEQSTTQNILMGQVVKITDLDKKVRKEQVVLPIKSSNFKKELYVKDIPFSKEAFEIDGFVYELKEDVATVYSSTNGQVTTEVKVNNATDIMAVK